MRGWSLTTPNDLIKAIAGLELEIAVRKYLEEDDESQLPPELIVAIEKWYRENRIGNGSR